MSASCPRPSKDMMKIAYRILRTPKELQQNYKATKKETEIRVQRLDRETRNS